MDDRHTAGSRLRTAAGVTSQQRGGHQLAVGDTQRTPSSTLEAEPINQPDRQPGRPGSAPTARWQRGASGGPAGNEQLTSITGVILIALLAVIGVTIVAIGQLISVHLFVGFLALGPVALKMASTGYRFTRYYAGSRPYREKGPPPLLLRAIAPAVVVCTMAVFVSGIVLMLHSPAHRGQWVLIHKVSFIGWLVVTALHVFGHLRGLPAGVRAGGRSRELAAVAGHASRLSAGDAGRWIAIVSALVAGAVIAIALIPDFAPWTAHGALAHHHHRS